MAFLCHFTTFVFIISSQNGLIETNKQNQAIMKLSFHHSTVVFLLLFGMGCNSSKDVSNPQKEYIPGRIIVLLDQSVIAGLGNIYVDESLWASKIHPLRKANTLSLEESSRLYKEVRKILRQAIKKNGTDFGDGVIHNGKFTPKVYGRGGESCKRCKGELERLVVAQRGTVVCNYCQEI